MVSNILRRARTPFVLLSLASLCGCAAARAGDGSPSLAPRAVEGRWTVDEAPPPLAPPGPLPTEVQARVAALTARIDAANTAFAAARPTAETAVSRGRGNGPGSEGWVAAHQAISRLDAARSAAPGALAELDALVLARTRDNVWDGMPALTTARDKAAASIAAQDALIAELAARLR